MNEISHPGFDKPEEYETFTTTNGLEEAAEEKYPVYWKDYPKDGIARSELSYDANEQRRDAFIVGAKWDRGQMMKEAIWGNVYPDDKEIWCNLDRFPDLKEGDKVRLIIIKEDNHE